uniref:Uncharacterized protein n=1 Tax=Sarcophilus harrisii TaxID=9305 RepID=A0A7N4NHY1_SARHA
MADLKPALSCRLGAGTDGLLGGGPPLCSLPQPSSGEGSEGPSAGRQARQRRKQKTALHKFHTQGRGRQQLPVSRGASAEPEMKVMLSDSRAPGSLGPGRRTRRGVAGGASRRPGLTWGVAAPYTSRQASRGETPAGRSHEEAWPARGAQDGGRCPGRRPGMAHHITGAWGGREEDPNPDLRLQLL